MPAALRAILRLRSTRVRSEQSVGKPRSRGTSREHRRSAATTGWARSRDSPARFRVPRWRSRESPHRRTSAAPRRSCASRALDSMRIAASRRPSRMQPFCSASARNPDCLYSERPVARRGCCRAGRRSATSRRRCARSSHARSFLAAFRFRPRGRSFCRRYGHS